MCHAGKYHGHSAIVAEVRIGSGKHAYNQTFVAVEQPTASRYERPKFVTALELQYVQQDRWVIGTISKQTLDVGAIEGYLNCFT